jgi:hypothetical protein
MDFISPDNLEQITPQFQYFTLLLQSFVQICIIVRIKINTIAINMDAKIYGEKNEDFTGFTGNTLNVLGV